MTGKLAFINTSQASANKDLSWKRFAWIFEQDEIKRCRQRFRDARDDLQFAFNVSTHQLPQRKPVMPNGNSTDASHAPNDVSPSEILRNGETHPLRCTQSENGKVSQASTKICESVWSSGIDEDTSRAHFMPSLNLQRRRPDLDGELDRSFRTSLNVIGTHIKLDTWLCIATWWLLKSRKVYHSLQIPTSQDESDPVDPMEGVWRAEVSFPQSYADLQKSSWIVEEIIIERLQDTSLSASSMDKLNDLLNTIDTEFDRRRSAEAGGIACTTRELRRQNLSLVEPIIQPLEHPQNMPQGLDELRYSPFRFMVVDIQHACHPSERVIYRKFINAQFGTHGFPTRSLTAPYILLLSCRDGSSDLLISLINQHGTINLSRAAYIEDFKRFDEDTRMDGGYLLQFPSQRTIVKFVHSQDKIQFLGHLRRLFEGLKDRRARPGEVLICREALQLYETRHPHSDDGEPEEPVAQLHALCEVNLYEQTEHENWQTVRRLVICSNPSSNAMFCTSHWLPLSQIQVQRQDEKISLSWSDCGQVTSHRDGSYGRWWSYIYNPHSPNRSISIHFESADAAKGFADSVLWPFNLPFQTGLSRSLGVFAPASGAVLYQLLELQDFHESQSKGSHALISVKQRSNLCHISDVYFIHRDFDFDIIKSMNRVTLCQIHIPHYISSIRDLPDRPTKENGVPTCKEIVLSPSTESLSFQEVDDLTTMMKGLTGWHLNYAKQVVCVSYSRSLLLKISYRQAKLYVWSRPRKTDDTEMSGALPNGNTTTARQVLQQPNGSTLHAINDYRLAIRCSSKGSHRHHKPETTITWLTCHLDHDTIISERAQAYKAILKEVTLAEGDQIDTVDFTATSPEHGDSDKEDNDNETVLQPRSHIPEERSSSSAQNEDDLTSRRREGARQAERGRAVRKLEIKFAREMDLHDFMEIVRGSRHWT